jgi:hypothetical protein
MSANRFLTQFDELLAYFNRRSMDVPEGFLARNAQFTLNGVSFETLLGRSASDPLIRLIARGPAAYRFAAKPLLHALDRALATRAEFDVSDRRASGTVVLRGTLRGSGDLFDERLVCEFQLAPGGSVESADVSIAETALARIREARAS